ncbi:glycoside hydrolase family 16 protein, partial [Mycena leptocephala]
WSLSSQLQGQAFLDFFDFELSTNDNGGIAQYVNGVTSGLAYTSGSQVVLAVDSTPNASPRKAVRMHSKTRFNAQDNNLFIFDVAHIPAVCGTWPAIWLTGTNWPFDGEIDVVEAANLYTHDVYSLHTGPGCTVPASAVSAMTNVQLVEAGATNCDATRDAGACGFSDVSSASFGPAFNSAGGGVFALEFAAEGIKTWFWTAGSVPADITNLAPTPSKWGTAAARLSIPTSNCSPETYFKDLLLVVNTNLAGSWPQGVWGLNGVGGQTQSCQTQTGVSTAAGYVTAHGSAFGAAAEWVRSRSLLRYFSRADYDALLSENKWLLHLQQGGQHGCLQPVRGVHRDVRRDQQLQPRVCGHRTCPFFKFLGFE